MPMKLAISVGALFLILGITAPAYAQHEQQGKAQGGQQNQQAKPAPQQRQAPANRTTQRPQ